MLLAMLSSTFMLVAIMKYDVKAKDPNYPSFQRFWASRCESFRHKCSSAKKNKKVHSTQNSCSSRVSCIGSQGRADQLSETRKVPNASGVNAPPPTPVF